MRKMNKKIKEAAYGLATGYLTIRLLTAGVTGYLDAAIQLTVLTVLIVKFITLATDDICGEEEKERENLSAEKTGTARKKRTGNVA